MLAIFDFCLNQYNGTFFDSLEIISLISNKQLIVLALAALYVNFLGINNFFITFIIIKLFILYNTYVRIANNHLSFLYSFITNSFIQQILNSTISFYLFILSLNSFLYWLYQLEFYRVITITHQILQPLLSIIFNPHTNNRFISMFLLFIIIRILSLLILPFYFKYSLKYQIYTFSLLGTYFFLKCISFLKWDGKTSSSNPFSYDNRDILREKIMKNIFFYLTFSILFSLSVFVQSKICKSKKNN